MFVIDAVISIPRYSEYVTTFMPLAWVILYEMLTHLGEAKYPWEWTPGTTEESRSKGRAELAGKYILVYA